MELKVHPTFTASPDLHITPNGSPAQACARTGVAGDNAQGCPGPQHLSVVFLC